VASEVRASPVPRLFNRKGHSVNRTGRTFNRTGGCDQHATTDATALDMARKINRALPPPARDQGVQRIDVSGDQRAGGTACLEREQAPDTGADGPRQSQEHRRLDRPGADLATGLRCEIVKGVGVLAQQIGRTCQCGNGSRPELGLKHGQQSPCPDPPVCRVAVVWVHPRRETGGFTGRSGGGPGQAEKGAEIRPAPGRHTGKGACPGAPDQAQQDLLSLVVAGVTEHDRQRAESRGHLFEGLVSRVSGLCLGA
jgi:hypothetical protein